MLEQPSLTVNGSYSVDLNHDFLWASKVVFGLKTFFLNKADGDILS